MTSWESSSFAQSQGRRSETAHFKCCPVMAFSISFYFFFLSQRFCSMRRSQSIWKDSNGTTVHLRFYHEQPRQAISARLWCLRCLMSKEIHRIIFFFLPSQSPVQFPVTPPPTTLPSFPRKPRTPPPTHPLPAVQRMHSERTRLTHHIFAPANYQLSHRCAKQRCFQLTAYRQLCSTVARWRENPWLHPGWWLNNILYW